MSATSDLSQFDQPKNADVVLAQEAIRALSGLAARGQALCVQATGQNDAVVLPDAAVRVLLNALDCLAAGDAVMVVPIHADLTIQQAADLLNVSRPFLAGLLKSGELPFHEAGSQRRVRREDLLAFKRCKDDARRAALDALARQGQDLGMGY